MFHRHLNISPTEVMPILNEERFHDIIIPLQIAIAFLLPQQLMQIVDCE